LCLLFNKQGGEGEEGGDREQGEEMAQTMYALMNICIKRKKENK
jgi:hypothetical protein